VRAEDAHEGLADRGGLFHKKRRGLSDLVATVLLVAITLISGAALFGYVNGQAAGSENQLGAANEANVNFLKERFVIVDVNFSQSNPSTSISIWIYNNGVVTLNITQIELYNNARSMDIFYQHHPSSTSCTLRPLPAYSLPAPLSNPLKITLILPSGCASESSFASGTTYYVNSLGVFGNIVVYSSCDSSSGCSS
jgi:flagellin-like protein